MKNLRGVLAALPGEELEPLVSWLSRRFRYRDLGLPPSLYNAEPGVFSGRLEGRPFHLLEYPTMRVEEAASRAVKVLEGTGLDRSVAEALLLASSYASPVIASPGAASQLEKLSILVVKGPVLDAQQARLHLRIVDYTVLDAYIEGVEEVDRCARTGCNPGSVREARRAWAERDSKRYWRIAGKGDKPVIIYVEHAAPLLEALGEELAGEAAVIAARMAAFNLDAVRL